MQISHVIEPVLALPRMAKRTLAIALDAGLCVLTVWLAFWLRLGEWIPLSGYGWPAALASVVLALPIFAVFGLYRTVFRYVSWDTMVALSQAVFIYGVVYAAVFTAFAVPGVPRTVGIIQPILLLLALAGARSLVRYWLGGRFRQIMTRASKQVMIYGAGSAGRQLAEALAASHDTRVVAFVDDAVDLQGSMIGRVPVIGPAKIESAIESRDVSEIYLALPSASQSRRNDILKLLRPMHVSVRTLPGLLDIASGRVSISHLRPLEIEDLLGRDPVAPDPVLMARNITGRVVLVTGAGGSIGSELCRQIVKMKPSRLLLLEASEFALYAIHRELARLQDMSPDHKVDLIPLLASVHDEVRMRRIFAVWTPATVYHAAAYKHVPLVEHNAVEGVRNNVIGTLTCASLAEEHGVGNFVLISSDKAVRPTNVMGASKRLAEMVLQALAARRGRTCFSMVRFGNVLGSSGSVVPLFRQQISAGGPITVTHPEMTRYFMTIPEAAQLVIQAGAMARGGEVFVLDMGESVRILDLAQRMIELSGLRPRNDDSPDGDIEITFTGLRPGEKLFEELLIGGNPAATVHPRIMKADEGFLSHAEIVPWLDRLRQGIADQDASSVRGILSEMLPEYSPSADIADWVFQEEASITGRRALQAQILPLR